MSPGPVPAARRRSAIAQLVDLSAQLDEDAGRPLEALRRRDRALAGELVHPGDDAQQAVTAWLDRVRPPEPGGSAERVERAHRASSALLAAIGGGVGSGAAAALFHYDGSQPVNVVRVLALFVGVQLALLCATAIASLPHRWRDAIPGVAALRDALGLLSPTRWLRGLRRLLPGPEREASQRLLGMLGRQRRLYGDVEKWWLLSGSQWFGVSFNLGAIATAFALVVFSDLAFAWSTTLDLSDRAFLRLAHLLSLPWASIWPDAVPSAELVTATQYYRASGHHSPAQSAPWWRFLLACMLVYGLAPRAAFLGLARWRLRVAVRRACRRMPGLAALRDRLESRLVETAAESDEAPPRALPPVLLESESELAGASCHALAWSGFPVADAQAASSGLGVEVLSLRRAGEGALENDALALRALAETRGDAPVLVLTKAWEPPVLELLDFIADLRRAVGDERAIVVAPLAVKGGRLAAPSQQDVDQWCRAVDRLADPWTTVYARRSR